MKNMCNMATVILKAVISANSAGKKRKSELREMLLL